MTPRPGKPIHFFQIALCAAVFTIATWPLFTWKGAVSFVPMWMAFEFYYRLRVRLHLHCSSCGFDPYLYLVDVKKARQAIETHWRRKFAEKGIPYPGDPAVVESEESAESAVDAFVVPVNPADESGASGAREGAEA